MSDSFAINIPTRSFPGNTSRYHDRSVTSASSTPSSDMSENHKHAARTPPHTHTYGSGTGSTSSSLDSNASMEEPRTPTSIRDKGKARETPQNPERRSSLLSSSISRSEHTVVNIGDPDGPPRLITCVKASQGFDWNQDIFLPSYISDHDYAGDLERRQDPVEDIFITEEEAEKMFPR